MIDFNNSPKKAIEANQRQNIYANIAIVHSSAMKQADVNLKKIIESESFNDNLSLKLREFESYVTSFSDELSFTSFRNDFFIDSQENYKKRIIDQVKTIKREMKKCKDFGTGNLLKKLIECIELPDNNLVDWHGKYGPTSKDHARLIELLSAEEQLKDFEETTWYFYFSEEQPEMYYFDYFTEIVNKKYSLIAYLYFIKNCSKYLPIATNTFDSFFDEMGIAFKTSKKCSWENYYQYISIIEYIKIFLRENLDPDACLLDAHSFIWILERQYKSDIEDRLYVIPEKIKLKEKDVERVAKARTGQGIYRKQLLLKWNNTSSISEYNNPNFLIASHIKPWKDCDNQECVDSDNGLLLTPNYDFLYDQGYISFDDDGSVIISDYLSKDDLNEFCFNEKIRIKSVSEEMKKYLEYHRNNVYKK